MPSISTATNTIMTRDMTSRKRCSRTTQSIPIIATMFGAAMCMGSGCALFQKDLVSAGTIQLEEASSDIARLFRVRVYQDDGDWAVYGKVGRKAGVKGRVDATVRVMVRFPDGGTLEEQARAFPPYVPIRRSRGSNFTVRFRGLPPTGTVVRIEPPSITSREAPASVGSFQNKEIRL